MPPVAEKSFCPIYRLDYLITKKSFQDKVPQKEIRLQLCALLGDITLKHLWRIRRAQIGESGILSADDLIKLKEYFSCSLDDLVVASSPIKPASPDVSGQETGLIFSDTSSHP